MNAIRDNTARRILRWVVAAATLIFAALLIWQCMDIYFTGTAPENLTENGTRIQDIYSREIVSERFVRIAWSFWLWLSSVIASAVVSLVFGKSKLKAVPMLPTEHRFALAIARAEKTPEMRMEEKKRRMIRIVCSVLCLAAGGFVLRYLLKADSFASRELEPVMGKLMLNVAPCVAIAFAALIGEAQFRKVSMLREIDMAKSAPKRALPKPKAKKNAAVNVVRILVAAVAVTLIVLGVQNGGMRDVLVKAVNICTECIGLG